MVGTWHTLKGGARCSGEAGLERSREAGGEGVMPTSELGFYPTVTGVAPEALSALQMCHGQLALCVREAVTQPWTMNRNKASLEEEGPVQSQFCYSRQGGLVPDLGDRRKNRREGPALEIPRR